MAERIAIETYRDMVRYFGDNPGHALGSPNPVPCKEKHRARSLETSGKCRLAPACTPSELHRGGGKAAEGDVGSRFVVSIAFEVGQVGVGIRLSVSSPSNTVASGRAAFAGRASASGGMRRSGSVRLAGQCSATAGPRG